MTRVSGHASEDQFSVLKSTQLEYITIPLLFQVSTKCECHQLHCQRCVVIREALANLSGLPAIISSTLRNES